MPGPGRPDLLLGQLAIRSGRITPEQLEECLAAQQAAAAAGRGAAPPPLGTFLLRAGYLSGGALQELLDAQAAGAAGPPAPPEDLAAATLLGQRLVALGRATAAQVDEALSCQARLAERGVPLRLGEILVNRGLVAPAQVAEALAVPERVLLYCPACRKSFARKGGLPTRAVHCPAC